MTTSHVTPHHTDPAGGYPTLTITENGAEKTLYVQYPEWTPEDDITVAGNAVDFAATSGDGTKFEYAKRLYLSESPTLDIAQYYRPNLLGGAIEYDVDLGDVSCGCVSSISAVRMPVMDNWRDAFHYCDANQMNEQRSHLCPEFDFMQANRHSFHSAAHKCDAPQNGVYTRCDRGGQCSLNPVHMRLEHGQRAYGYGTQYKINTQFPFHVELEFQQRDDYFLGYKWTITQGGNEIMMEQRDCSQTLRHMTDDMSQMVIVLSNWDHRDLNWMQHGQCQAHSGCPRGELSLH